MKRPEQLAHALRDLVGAALPRVLELPQGVLVTVTRAELSRDAYTATLYVSVYPEREIGEVLQKLEAHRGTLQHVVNDGVRRHATPRIRFAADPAPLALQQQPPPAGGDTPT